MPDESTHILCDVCETLIECIRKQDSIIQQSKISVCDKQESARLAENAERAFKFGKQKGKAHIWDQKKIQK